MEARNMDNKVELDEHLIWEILLRLPVKSLVRFKCVSKSWLSVVSDVTFAKLHFDLTASHTPQLLFSVSIDDSNKSQIRSVDSEGSLEVHSVNFVSPFQSPLEADYVNILGVCRGFILLEHGPKGPKPNMWVSSLPSKNLLVWNPSTGFHKTLSYSKNGSFFANSFSSAPIIASFGLEYDAFTDDYFVIIAWIQVLGRPFPKRLHSFEIFSMRTNSWKEYPCTEWCTQSAFKFFNGAIHWMDLKIGESVKAIITFDLTERNCSEIPLPHDGFVYDWIRGLRLEVIGGCLCLLYGPGKPGFDELWIMKEYKVKSSWIKCNYVPENATPLPECYFSPIYFTKGGQIVGYLNSNMSLAKINDKGELLHHRPSLYKKYHIYTESLLSLPTDSGQPSEDDQN